MHALLEALLCVGITGVCNVRDCLVVCSGRRAVVLFLLVLS